MLMYVAVAAIPACMADIMTIDSFSTSLSFTNGVFKNSAGTVISPGGSNIYDSANKFVRVDNGNSAEWQDTGAGILGGTRKVLITNNPAPVGPWKSSTLTINSGELGVNSPSNNFLCLTCLQYSFALTPVNVALYHFVRIDLSAFNPVYKPSFQTRLSISDGTTTAVLTMSNFIQGINKFDLSAASNWTTLNKSSVTSAMLEFTTSANGVDFNADMIAFSTNPEPGTFGILAAAMAGVAVRKYRKNRNVSRGNAVQHQAG
jgi:hypothetical protein